MIENEQLRILLYKTEQDLTLEKLKSLKYKNLLDTAVRQIDELKLALADLEWFASRMPGYNLHPLTERTRKIFDRKSDGIL
jgi:hypothetical protein